MGVLDASRSRPVMCWKQYCGFNTGAQWHMLPQSYPNYKTVHRRFQTWCCNEHFASGFDGRCDEFFAKTARWMKKECFIDAAFVTDASALPSDHRIHGGDPR